MKKISITCDDALALTISQLLIDQAIAFSVQPWEGEGIPEGGIVAKRHATAKQAKTKFGISADNRGLMAVLAAGVGGGEFSHREVGRECAALGLNEATGSSSLSRAAVAGVCRQMWRGVYQLTQRGADLARRGSAEPLMARITPEVVK